MNSKIKLNWTKQALEGFNSIQSKHFTTFETKEYKKVLVKRIQERIFLLGTTTPTNHTGWEGSYKIIVDKYIVYYSFSDDREICYIEYFKHSRQKR